jgi:hypothetical protein
MRPSPSGAGAAVLPGPEVELHRAVALLILPAAANERWGEFASRRCETREGVAGLRLL